MNEQGERPNRENAGIGFGALAGMFVLLATLAFIPARFDALNFFDPAKRLVWAMLASLLAILCWRRPRQASGPVVGPALALAGWMIVRSLSRPVPTAELGVLASWCLPIALFCLGWGMAPSRHDRRMIGGFLVAAGLIQAVLMVLQRAGLDPVFAATTAEMDYVPGRMVGTIGYQNQAVDFLALSVLGILLITASPAWFICGASLLLPVIVLTGNRGGILAFAVAVFFSGARALLAHPRMCGGWRRFAALAGAMLVCVGLLVTAVAFIPQTRGRFLETFTDFKTAPAIQSRLLMARISWLMFQERPVTGWGAGEYAMQYLDRLGVVLPAKKTHKVLQSVVFAREAHNDLLQFAAEFGLIGLALLTGLIVAGWLCLSRQKPVLHGQGIELVYVFSYMAVSALFSFPWQSAMAGPLAAFLIGLAWPSRSLSSEPSKMSRPSLYGGHALVLLLAIGLLGWYGRDACLNLAIPARLVAGDTDGAARMISGLDYRYHALVGASQAGKGRYDLALRTLRHARFGYRDVWLWNNLGHVFTRNGEWSEAKTVYAAWAACGLDHANALQNLSIACEHAGDFHAASESLFSRMRLWPDAVSARDVKRLAVLHMRAGASHDAAETLKRYHATWETADSRTLAEMKNLAGSIAHLHGEREQAVKWFRSALEHDPDLESARKNLDAVGGLNSNF